MSVLRRIGLFAGAGVLALSTAACSSSEDEEPPVASGPASVAPAPSSAEPATAVPSSAAPSAVPSSAGPAPTETTATLRPGRQFVFATEDSRGKSMLTVTPGGALGLTEDFSDRALFVPVPIEAGRGTYLVKTGKLRAGGEAYCLTVASGGKGNPLQVRIAACDTSERDQRFTFPDGENGNAVLMEAGGVFVHQWSGTDRIVAEESGEGDNLTAFVLTDHGRAAIPALG